MRNLRQTAQQALTDMKDLEHTISALTGGKLSRLDDAIGRLEQALAEPEQEPVIWADLNEEGEIVRFRYHSDGNPHEVALYDAPTA